MLSAACDDSKKIIAISRVSLGRECEAVEGLPPLCVRQSLFEDVIRGWWYDIRSQIAAAVGSA